MKVFQYTNSKQTSGCPVGIPWESPARVETHTFQLAATRGLTSPSFNSTWSDFVGVLSGCRQLGCWGVGVLSVDVLGELMPIFLGNSNNVCASSASILLSDKLYRFERHLDSHKEKTHGHGLVYTVQAVQVYIAHLESSHQENLSTKSSWHAEIFRKMPYKKP